MDEKERIYDEQIAPLLWQAAKLCDQHGLPMVARVEWSQDSPEEFGRTEVSPQGIRPTIGHKLSSWAVRCAGNLDSFLMACIKHAKEYGHQSAYLRILDVDETPKGMSYGDV